MDALRYIEHVNDLFRGRRRRARALGGVPAVVLVFLLFTTCTNPTWIEHSRYTPPAALRPQNYDSELQWNMEMINAPGAWGILDNLEAGGVVLHPVVVAVLDTGIQADHPGLSERMLPNHHRSFTSSGSESPVSDPDGHGTHVAGIVAAVPADDGPIFGTTTGAEDTPVKLLSVKVLSDTGGGYTSDVANGVDYVTELRVTGAVIGAHVINLSLGEMGAADPALFEAIGRAVDNGITVVAASGNSDRENVFYPAGFSNTIAVGAVDGISRRWVQPGYGSNYGNGLDFMAPGANVLSTYTGSHGSTDPVYAVLTGTSMATPHVAGIAALLYAIEPGLDQDAVYSVLRATARDLGAPGWDDYHGHGLVDVQAALEYLMNLRRRIPRAPMGADDPGASRGISLQTAALSGAQYPEPRADIDSQSVLLRFRDGQAPVTDADVHAFEARLKRRYGIASARPSGVNLLMVELAPGQTALDMLGPLGDLDEVQYSQPNYRYQVIR